MSEIDRLFGDLDRPVSRRELLRRMGRGSMYAGVMAFLAACGVQGQRQAPQKREPLPPQTGELVMANWPAYIDRAEGTYSPTVRSFQEKYDISMKYDVTINDNEQFFGTIREPLARGESSGYDIIVMTDWMINKLIRLGYLEQLHHEELTNWDQYGDPKFKDPWYDPGNRYSIPWAAGITGIGYNISLTGREITSVNDLFDPAFEGKVGMFTEMRDTFGFVLATMGIEEPNATIEDVQRAQQVLLEHRQNFRGFYGNDYLDAFALGDLAVTMAWSGDVFAVHLDDPNLRFVLPEEGGMRWTDNMCIPAGAENPTDAHLFMNYVYDPQIATNITEWVWYESPVEPVHDMVIEDAKGGPDYIKQLAASNLVWPDESTLAQTIPYKRLDEEEEQAWNDLFQEVVQG